MQQDFELAKWLQELEYETGGWTKNNTSPAKENGVKSSSLIDPSWELIDPNPNIYSLFQAFDKKYFWTSLGSVEVKWSPRMYTCAGICTYKGKGGCVVSLSLPLLKLRPRKDLIETLLHEMIHAYLFMTKNDRDRNGHGPQFHKHMYRINAEAGTNITVYHSFHDEVRHYRTHWWRCDGPCRLRHPFYGIVKRAMNRAPGPSDLWYAEHQANCGGSFVKTQEPEGFKSKKKTNKAESTPDILPHLAKSKGKPSIPKSPISTFVGGRPKTALVSNTTSGSFKIPGKKLSGGLIKTNVVGAPTNGSQSDIVKISSANNVHGFGSTTDSSKAKPTAAVAPFSGSGHVLATNVTANDRSRSKLLDLYPPPSKKPKPTILTGDPIGNKSTTVCPICEIQVPVSCLNKHLDACAQMDFSDEPFNIENLPVSPPESIFANCSICDKKLYRRKMGEHIIECRQTQGLIDLTDDLYEPGPASSISTISAQFTPTRGIVKPPSHPEALYADCPICHKQLFKKQMEEHLVVCRQSDALLDLTEDFIELGSATSIPSISAQFTPTRGVVKPPSHPEALYTNCPICNKQLFKKQMDEHLIVCRQSDALVDLTEDLYEPGPASSMSTISAQITTTRGVVKPPSHPEALYADCPICNKQLFKKQMNEHLIVCRQLEDLPYLTEDFNEPDPATRTSVSHPHVTRAGPSSASASSSNPLSPSSLFANCPVCDQKLFKNKMDEHLDSCIRLDSIMDNTGSEIENDDDEPGTNEAHCPCCNVTFPLLDINAHLDNCLQGMQFE